MPIRDQLLTTLSLSGAGYYPRKKLIDVACSHPGCEDRDEVERELDALAKQGLVVQNEGLVYAVPTEHDLSTYFAAADKYRKEMAKRNSWRYRGAVFLANIWAKIWGGVVLLVATSSLTLGLCAVEVPNWVIKGIAAVETGTDYRGVGDVRGSFSRGKIGEVSPWQISPAVLRDLGAYDRRFRIHSDVVFAESLARAWLTRLYRVTGSWSQAVAAYHSGLGKRKESFATAYADRVFAVGSTK